MHEVFIVSKRSFLNRDIVCVHGVYIHAKNANSAKDSLGKFSDGEDVGLVQRFFVDDAQGGLF